MVEDILYPQFFFFSPVSFVGMTGNTCPGLLLPDIKSNSFREAVPKKVANMSSFCFRTYNRGGLEDEQNGKD
jgi:hypothetical protein